ncbi:MAG: cell wall hydrolase, partial [Christensenellales bacterium]
RKKKGIIGRALWFSSLFSFKRNAAARAKDDALAFAENGRRLGRRARRNRRIFLYAGTGVAVIAVMLIVFLVPGGMAAPAEATKGASPMPQPTVLSAAGGLPIPALTATPTPAVSVTPFPTSSLTQTAAATPDPTPEPTPSPTPVPTTPPEPTPKPVDLNKLVKFFVVEADKYYNEMGYSNNHYDYTEEEKYMLAQVIDAEARGESMEGKIAVGNVVLNRVLCRSFPGNTIQEVVTRPGQFAYNPNRRPTSASKRAAAAVLDDEKWVVAQDVYYFRSGVEEGVNWGSHKFYKKIGGHCFYRHSYSGRHRGGDPPPALYERTFKYVQYGCKKANRVKRIQYMLNKLGYDVKTDGYFGLTSKKELMKFQEDKGLEADGVAGPATIKALIKAFGVEKYIKKWGK